MSRKYTTISPSEVLAKIEAFINANPEKNIITPDEMHFDLGMPWKIVKEYREETKTYTRGKWKLVDLVNTANLKLQPPATLSSTPTITDKTPAAFNHAAAINSMAVMERIEIPEVDSNYVRWGHHTTLEKVIKSGQFFPVYITGMSGNGKTLMVEQACARAKRELIRIQITPETDEDTLIGGWRLQDGNTVFVKGPVIRAMEAGAILLLDEMDRGTNKMMVLQSVLEGNPILIAKTGEVVKPAAGFNVIATTNTKGRGSDDGRYTAATIIDDAFLERFVATFEQSYPPIAVEQNIVTLIHNSLGLEDEEFVKILAAWSASIRKTFDDGGVDETISTRRLIHIMRAYSILGDREKAIEACIARFSQEITEPFMELYRAISPEQLNNNNTPEKANETE